MTGRGACAAILLAALSTVSAGPGGAQDSAVVPLSLLEAVQAAERHSPRFRMAINDRLVAEAEVRQAWAQYLPSLSADLRFGGYSSRRLTTFDQFGNAVRLEDPITFRSSQASQGLSLGLMLLDGGARERELSAARFEEDAAGAGIAAERGSLYGEIGRRYWQAVGAERRIALEERLLASAREQLAATERLFRIAGVNRVAVLGAEIEVATREAELERVRGEAQKAALQLREAIGMEQEVPFDFTDSLPSAAVTIIADADSLVALAMRVNPRLKMLEARARAAESRAAAVRGSRWPTLSAHAGFSRSFSDRDYQALFEFDPPDQSLSFGFSAWVPIFDRFQASTAIARAAASAGDVRQEARAMRLQLAREVRAAAIDLENASRRLGLAERSAALSREQVEMAHEQYRAGATSFTELQLVLDRAATAERSVLDARVTLATALATLEQAVGAPVTP